MGHILFQNRTKLSKVCYLTKFVIFPPKWNNEIKMYHSGLLHFFHIILLVPKSAIFKDSSYKVLIFLLFASFSVPANCEYMDQPGTYLPFTDTYLSRVNDIEECRSRCTIQNKYNCRSFNYNAFRKECFLSSDDR